MATLDITFDDVLREIDRLSALNTEGFTVQEMSIAVGRGPEWCRIKMAKLIQSGKAFCNGRAKRYRIDGLPTYVPVYLIKKE
uniref:Uncharacterized protein n=1 Tax=viral metagenome TaxID=1070528 RepID=A0A6H1ZLC1_9ZZZZ